MKRFKVLFGQRRFQALITIAAVLLAASVVAASGANFTSTSANASNTFTAGNLHHVNSNDGAAILTVEKMKPGDTQSGTVTITNDGDLDGAFTIAESITGDQAGSGEAGGSGHISDVLQLTVTDTTTGLPVYSGLLKDMGTVAAGTIVAGAAHTYDFTVTFPDSGANGADNSYKKSAVTAQFDWVEAQ